MLRASLQNKTGRIILITPERNLAAVSLYKKSGMEIVAKFDQNERNFNTGKCFNLPRIVMAGSISRTIAT